MTRLLLVRHGQSEWNAAGRWQGQADPELTDLGRHQARHAARAVGAVDAVFTSPLRRAAATAGIISGEIGVGPVVTLDGLMERHAGEWQGLTRDEIGRRWPGFLEAHRRPPGWEDDRAVVTRVVGALDAIERTIGDPDAHVLVVAHAGVIFAVEAELGAPWERLANLGGRWLEHDGSNWQLGERVHLLIEETIPDQI